jgi:hypothetical protein
MLESAHVKAMSHVGGQCVLTRRQALRATAAGLGGVFGVNGRAGRVEAAPNPGADDVAIDATTAQLFCAEAPLAAASGLRDARAVWCHVPENPDQTVLIYFHGHNGYVTVDASGRSRVPDWAAANDAARAGASAKQAAPLIYGLNRLEPRKTGKKPVVVVPEVSTLANGSFWAKEPAGQYADPARLGALIADCVKHLACLHRPDGRPYLTEDFVNHVVPINLGRVAGPIVDRVFLCGHSGAGLPLEEAARSALILPETGVPSDLWLFDCTYWSRVEGFVRFCDRWNHAGRLAGGRRDAARFVCIYRPRTQTEEVADSLRSEIARVIGADATSIVKDHTPENFDKEIRPVLKSSGVIFVRSYMPHDDIPTFFIPALLESAGISPTTLSR